MWAIHRFCRIVTLMIGCRLKGPHSESQSDRGASKMRLAYRPSLSRRVSFVKIINVRQIALRILVFLTAALLLPMSAELAGAQDIFGRISGTVTDPTGAGVPNVKVTLTNQETKIDRTDKADGHGFYVAPALQAGTYKETAEAKTFTNGHKAGHDIE